MANLFCDKFRIILLLPVLADFPEDTERVDSERQACYHGVNSDTLRLRMVAVQSNVGTSSNRAISREPKRHNQGRTEVRGLTILIPSK